MKYFVKCFICRKTYEVGDSTSKEQRASYCSIECEEEGHVRGILYPKVIHIGESWQKN